MAIGLSTQGNNKDMIMTPSEKYGGSVADGHKQSTSSILTNKNGILQQNDDIGEVEVELVTELPQVAKKY